MKTMRAAWHSCRSCVDELDMPVAALLDTKGPEIRLRDFKMARFS